MERDLIKFFNSEEGKRSLEEFGEKLRKEEETKNAQLSKFHNKFGNEASFVEFVEKVIQKYDSDKYVDFWYNRWIEPPEDLFWFLFQYAEKYGRECDENEMEVYGNMFTSAMFFIYGYYFNRMDGQGSVIKVVKQEN